MKNKQWVRVTAEVHLEYKEEYHGIGPVLYAKRIEKKPISRKKTWYILTEIKDYKGYAEVYI